MRLFGTAAIFLLATLPGRCAPPIGFECNQGQTDPKVRFLARGHRSVTYLTQNEIFASSRDGTVRMTMLNTSPGAQIEGVSLAPGYSNYVIGNAPEKQIEHVPIYRQVRYADVDPGTDLVFHGNGEIEYDVVLRPGSDSSRVRLQFPATPLNFDRC